MPRPRKPKQAPSETYAARSARGRPQVSLSVPQEWLARIDAAVHAGRAQTRSALVVAAVDAWLASSDRVPRPMTEEEDRAACDADERYERMLEHHAHLDERD